jgi:hypothetical protein
MNCEYVKEHYGVPACIGRRVDFRGREGVITEDKGNYIGVTFDDEKPGTVSNLHPTWKVEYLGMGVVREREMTRSQKNYQEYLKIDPGMPFGEWMGFRSREEVRRDKERRSISW